jgi:hypothetical protein
MNNEFLKYLGLGALGLYVYRQAKGKGPSKEFKTLMGKSEQFVDMTFSKIEDPVLRRNLKTLTEKIIKAHLNNHANVRDVTPLEARK